MSLPSSATSTSAARRSHAGDRAQQLNRGLEKADLLLDPDRQRVDVVLEFLDVREHPLEQECVVA